MPRITREQVTAEPWRYDSTHWRLAHGIPIPHIAEISPMQYARLSKRGKRAYDAKRHDEWNASIAGTEAWQQAVIAAYDAGRFTLDAPEVNDRAAWAVRRELDERAKQQATDDETTRRTIARPLTVGDQVWSIMARATGTVTKVNPKSVKVRFALPYKTFALTMQPAALQWPDGR